MQIQMQLPFPSNALSEYGLWHWHWLVSSETSCFCFYWNSYFCFCSNFFCFCTSFLFVAISFVLFFISKLSQTFGWVGRRPWGPNPTHHVYAYVYMKGPNINQFWAKYQPAHFYWGPNINQLRTKYQPAHFSSKKT